MKLFKIFSSFSIFNAFFFCKNALGITFIISSGCKSEASTKYNCFDFEFLFSEEKDLFFDEIALLSFIFK